MDYNCRARRTTAEVIQRVIAAVKKVNQGYTIERACCSELITPNQYYRYRYINHVERASSTFPRELIITAKEPAVTDTLAAIKSHFPGKKVAIYLITIDA